MRPQTRFHLYVMAGTVLSLFVSLFLSPMLANAHDPPGSQPAHDGSGLLYDAHKLMTSHGLTLETVNTIDILSNVSGGLRRKTALVGDLDLLLTVDGEQLLGLNNSTFFVYGLGLYGEDPTDNVGDIQTVSSIAAPNNFNLFEAWYQYNWADRFSLLAGLYDVTSEFDVLEEPSELFLQSSFGTGAELAASGLAGPSTLPATALAIRGQAFVGSSTAVRAVIADGVPGNPNDPNGTQVVLRSQDGIFWGTEVAYYQFSEGHTKLNREAFEEHHNFRRDFQRVGRAAPSEYAGKYALGVWGYTTELEDFRDVDRFGNPIKRDATYGIYGLAEQLVFTEQDDEEQGLVVFLRAGVADPRVNQFSQYYGGGLIYRGLLPGRPTDYFGFGVAAARNSSHFKQAQRRRGTPVNDAEIALEMTYAINVTPELLVQPDIQYIINPGTNPSIDNALVLGLRVGMHIHWFESDAP